MHVFVYGMPCQYSNHRARIHYYSSKDLCSTRLGALGCQCMSVCMKSLYYLNIWWSHATVSSLRNYWVPYPFGVHVLCLSLYVLADEYICPGRYGKKNECHMKQKDHLKKDLGPTEFCYFHNHVWLVFQNFCIHFNFYNGLVSCECFLVWHFG